MNLSFFCILFLSWFNNNGQHPANRSITIIAHRGDHSQAPENTLKAFQDAIANGADYIEVDLRTSSDNKLVVMHDATVDRVTDGSGLVNSLSLSHLQNLSVSDKLHPSFGVHKIPTFEDVLKIAKGKINIYLDFKEADVSSTFHVIRQFQMEESVVVYINKPEQFVSWRKIAPGIPLMVSLPDSVDNAITMRQFLNTIDAEILDGGADQYTTDMIKLAKSNHRRIWVDVQSLDEGPQKWNSALAKGVDGLQTDHLSSLKSWLAKAKK